MRHYVALVIVATLTVIGCSRPVLMFMREVSLKVEDPTSRPAAGTYVTLEPVNAETGDVRRQRERLDGRAAMGISTVKTDPIGHATVPLRFTEYEERASKALLRVRRDTYFGYTVIPLAAGARANLGNMAVEIISIGPKIPYDSLRGTPDGESLRWKGDQGYSK